MASRPSIVFLFDLDLPSVRGGSRLVNSDDDFSAQCTRLLRPVVLNILNYFSEKQVNIQWGYRFYSSSSYQLTNKAHFVDLTSQTVEEFEEALNVRFEQNSALTDGGSLNDMAAATVLSRTLQDIISDYEWKPPSDSLTPTRKGKKPGKQLDQSLQNLVFILTEVPSDDALSSFCKFSVQGEPSIKAVTEAILPKELAKRFQEFQLSLNFIDLSYDTKAIFRKVASNLRGTVINALALTSPFSFSQILQASCAVEDIALEECKSCQSHFLGSKVLISPQNEQPIELHVQCWNHRCTHSSLCLEDTNVNIPVIKCMTVQTTSIPSSSWLKHDSLYLLSSRISLVPKFLAQKTTWIGEFCGQFCCISPVTSHTALLLFTSSNGSLFHSWAGSLLNSSSVENHQVSTVRSFVEKLLEDDRRNVPFLDNPSSPISVQESIPHHYFSQLRGNYIEKKGAHMGFHWQMLKNSFNSEELHEKFPKEFNNNSFDQLSQSINVDASLTTHTNSNEGPLKKIGSNRIQNLRASTLLQKSQEVRARNDEMEREKINKEKQLADERKKKIWKEFQTYLLSLRSSIGCGEEIVQLVPNKIAFDHQDILERCLKLKEQAFTSQLEDWQWLCLVQVIVSTILYVWKEVSSIDIGYETICKSFLKRPAAANRLTAKDNKIYEFKFQIILRLELSWVVSSLVGEEEDVVQDATSLFQMLSIHSSPQIVSSFFQDALVASYESMLPEFLVSLGEELNQSIPASLSDQVKMKNSIRTPSPTLSSKTLSVQSLTSQYDMNDSHRSNARNLRSRTLSRQPSLNVLQHKKQIALPNKVERVQAPAKKEETNEVVRVRRSLQFGAETPLQKDRIKSPAKGSVTSRRLNTSIEQLAEFTTPCKANDFVLAPETPSRLRSDGKHMKSDGVHVVGESPEVKQDALRRSPRRLEAAIALRRRASFYSTLNSELNPEKGASRNWSRAESQVWSEKAKANASIQTPLEDNSPQIGQSARFLFSKILSRNDSMPSTEAMPSPRKSVIESDILKAIPLLSTPRKGGATAGLFPPTTPSRQRLTVPETGGSVLAPGTPMKTPMKTPKHVQFNFSFQPATPTSKTVPDPRSILKSPMGFQSPSQSRTPRKIDAQEPPMGQHLIHVLDDTNFNGRHQLVLNSPVKLENSVVTKQEEDDEEEGGTEHDVTANDSKLSTETTSGHDDELVHKLDEKTLKDDEEIAFQSPSKTNKLLKISPLVLRRSPRLPLANQVNHGTNFYHHNPNWSVINYRRPNIAGISNAQPRDDLSRSVANDPNHDPYAFDDDIDGKPKRTSLADSSSHKRKLFQSSVDKTPTTKRRRIIPNTSPAEELKTPPSSKFQAPREGSLFHLENSPLLNSIEAKFLA